MIQQLPLLLQCMFVLINSQIVMFFCLWNNIDLLLLSFSVFSFYALRAEATIREEDVKFLMDECEISREATEALLRANGCDVKKAIQAYIKSPVAIH